jgi:UDP-N-acetylglucosamine--N-acetylmuramyl-(pentapeptide) pyrophosphoryl-undecaprenol N-acetylglucosamine transferase
VEVAGMKVLIAGGGTGGHLFPGIAVAEEIVARDPRNQVLFVGTARGIEVREVPKAGFPLELVRVSGLKGKGPLAILFGLFRLPWALVGSLRILGRYRPAVVLGVGGYASGPVLLAARLRGIPTAIQEQNASAGVTNRILGHLVRIVFTAFPEAGSAFAAAKVRQLGNPIRRKLLDNFLEPHVREPSGRFPLLIIGGSQGAHALNLAVPEALALLPPELRAHLDVRHQTGARDRDSVAARFRELGIQADVADFISDMSSAYAWASLVVGRAGASTLAELAVCRRAAILVPFPAAADDHQTKNARALVQSGAAVLIPESELTPERLAGEIAALAQNPARLASMEQASARLGRPESAREIGEVLSQLAIGSPHPGQRASPTRPAED